MTATAVPPAEPGLGDITTAIRTAHPDDKAQVYRQLGLRLTYHPDTQTVHAETNPGVLVCPGLRGGIVRRTV